LPERNLLPKLTAYDNILFAMQVGNYTREQRKKRVLDLLNQVGLSDRKDHTLGKLSGGEAQRIGLAVSLANNPKILFADEPTGELDSETTMDVISYLQDLNNEENITIVVVTHDNRFERMTQKSYNILDGSIAGIRRSLDNENPKNWASTKREQVGVVNQFGNVRIPTYLREKYKIKEYVKFVEDIDSNKLYIEPADE
jgi:putative ABC transport system ATP-binding protein